MKKLLALSVAIWGAATLAQSESPDTRTPWEKYFTAETYQIAPVAEPLDYQIKPTPVDDCTPKKLTDTTAPDLGGIIAVGEKLWKLIEAGRPVVNFKTPLVHVLPDAAPCWADLETWQAPKSQLWEIAYKNGFGMEVVKFRFRITYMAGGSLDNRGKFLANVTVQPADVKVSWGFNFSADTQIGRAVNLGTRQDPVAGVQLMVAWDVKSITKENLMTENFFISGDGKISKQ